MGRNKDRIYQTAGERREEGTGHSGRLAQRSGTFARLPFHCCAISFQPFEDPVCAPDGTVFDIVNAVPYIRKHGRHPVTGEHLELKDLIQLHFHRNRDGEYACPVLGKVFNENTHIVAIATTGNVYCWDAIQELCIKPKNLNDLMTDEPFQKKDIIHLQDPNNVAKRNINEFDHVRHERSIEDEETIMKRESDPMFGIRHVDEGTRRALMALGSTDAATAAASGGGGKKAEAQRLLALAKAGKGSEKASIPHLSGRGDGLVKSEAAAARTGDPRLRSAPRVDVMKTVRFKPGTSTWNTDAPEAVSQKNGKDSGKDFDPNAGRKVPAPYSNTWIESFSTTGRSAVSLTSTSMDVVTKSQRQRKLQHLEPKKKGYARIHTSLGYLNIELHCDLAPKTCENWLALAESGYYNGTSFHRVIKNFMAQGGDPTGTGKGGTSIWGPTFEDEFHHSLMHDTRGVVSMCNAGPNTNGSQFFVTFKSARHLDRKHTVFGKIVGGFETLTALERLPTDDEDRPLDEVVVTSIDVYVNPYKDMLAEREEEVNGEESRSREMKNGSQRSSLKKRKDLERDNIFAAAAEVDDGGDEESTWLGGPVKKPASLPSLGGRPSSVPTSSGHQGVGRYMKVPDSIKTAVVTKTATDDNGNSNTKKKLQKSRMVNFDAW